MRNGKISKFFTSLFVILSLAVSSLYPALLALVGRLCGASWKRTISVVTFATLFIVIILLAITNPGKHISLTDALRSFLKEPPGRESNRWYRFLSVWIFLTLVFQVSWLFDSVRDVGLHWVTTSKGWDLVVEHHVVTFALALEFIILMPLIYIRFIFPVRRLPAHRKPLPRKVLIMGLSLPLGDNAPEKQKELLRRKLEELGNPRLPNEEALKSLQGNWIPALRAILYENGSLELVILILSDSTKGYFDDFIEFIKLVPHLKERLESENLKVSGSNEVDANDFVAVRKEIERIMAKIRNYDDSDISFNITGGTSMMSAAMILEAVVGERQAEYVRQSGDRELIRIDVSEKDLPLT